MREPFFSTQQPEDAFVVCWQCGDAGRVSEFHGDNYSLDGEPPEWAYHCEKCDQDTKRNAEEMMPKVHQMIENAMMREGIKFE